MGGDFFIGIYGGKEEIEIAYNLAHNYGATNGKLYFLKDETKDNKDAFAYYATEKKQLEKSLALMFTVQTGNPKKGKTFSSQFISSLKQEPFIRHIRACRI